MTPVTNPTRHEIALGYVLLAHVVPVIAVMSATAAFALIVAEGWPGLGPMACLLGAMLGGQVAIGAVNELADAELDAVAKPNKPIPAGLVTRRGAVMVAGAGLLAMVTLSLSFGAASFLLCTLGTGAGIAYSVWFKRTIWSWIPYLVALPLLPIWVWAALDEVHPGLFAIYPIGAAAVIAVQIAQSLPDIGPDSDAGVRTLAVALGPRQAQLVCWGSLLLAAVLAAALAPWLTDRPVRVWLAAALAITLVVVNVAIWRRDARQGALASFPCVAAGAALLGLGWAAALTH